MKKYSHYLFLTAPLVASLSFSALPALGYQLDMIPPEELTLNGEDIVEGAFQITQGIGYTSNGSQIALGASLPKSDAEIGDATPFTLYPNIPDNVEVLELIGNFTSSNPLLTPSAANFHIIVGGFQSEPWDFTYYLPATTSQALSYQITDVESDPVLDDNTNTFLDSTFWRTPTVSLTPPTTEQLIDTFTQTGQTWYISSSPTGDPPPPPTTSGCGFLGSSGGSTPPMNPHGGSITFQQNCRVPEPNLSLSLLAFGLLGAGYGFTHKIRLNWLKSRVD